MATAISQNCAAVNQALLAETGRLGSRMFNRSARKRPIIRLMSKTRGAWQNGMGVELNAVTFERAFPLLTGDGWTDIAVSDGADVNSCLPPNEVVGFGQTSRAYKPKHYSISTQDFCIRDIQFGWQYAEFLNNVTRALETITEWTWYRRYVLDYFTRAGHKLTLSETLGIQDSATVYNTSNLPTGALSQGVLDDIYGDLWREGADKPSGNDIDTNQAAFTLITSPETSRRIILNNPQLRDDVRYAFMGKGNESPLIPGLSTKRRHYGGWIHEIDPYPRRFTFAAGAYIEIAPFLASGTTKGNKWEQNAAYKAAPFEEFIIWHEDNYQSLAVNTVDNPAPGWNFTPRTWMGSFSWRNILEKTCNPDGQIGFFRALFADAAKPINPSVGYVGIAARCSSELDLNSCYES